jgi:hypothetical protein
VSVLAGLEGEVVKTLQSIKKGIAVLDERRADVLDAAGPADATNGTGSAPRTEVEGATEPVRS